MSMDVQLVDGDLPHFTTHIRGPAVTLQRIEIRLRTFVGEWLLDESQGLPYIEWIAQKPTQVDQISDVLRAEVETTPGVISVDSWVATRVKSSRRMSIAASITIEDSDDTIEAEILPFGADSNGSPAILWSGGQGTIVAGGIA